MNGKPSRLVLILASLLALLLLLNLGVMLLNHRKPSSLADQSSYTVGLQFGKSLASQNLTLDAKMVSRGLADALEGHPSQLSDDEMQAAMAQLNEQRRKDAADEALKNKSAADEFMTSNGVAEGVKTTKSGLQYKILREGTGPSPKLDDVVVVQYVGKLIDGKEFDSSLKRGVPAEFPLRGVMPGWAEGLQLMKKGGKALIFVPPQLGYGDRPRQNIPANAVLIFDVDLIDVHVGAGPARMGTVQPPSAPPKHK